MSSVKRPAKYTREEPEVRRAELIQATIRCLGELGASATSVREVAARANVSPGLIRHHFGGMDALVLEAYRTVGDLVATTLDAAVEAAGDDPAARLEAFVTANFRPPILAAELLAVWLAFWSLVQQDAAVRALHGEIYAANRRRLEELILAVGGGASSSATAHRQAIALTALIDGLWLEHCLDPTTFTADEAMAMLRATLERFPT